MRTTMAVAALAALTVLGSSPAAGTPLTVPHDSEPWWAPRGTMIAFQREAPGLESSDVLFTPATRGSEVDIVGPGRARGFRPGTGDLLVETGSSTLVRDGSDREIGRIPGVDATWSPDGTQVAFLDGDVLAVAAASGENVRPLLSGISPPPSDLTGPSWSPDGSSIAIATTNEGGSAVMVVAVDGSSTNAAYTGPGENSNPSWSRDGAQLAFERYDGARWAVWLVSPEGGDAREAFAGPANNRFPQWSPTDDRLAFLSDRAGTYGLYVGNPNGSPQELIDAVSPFSPARWSPTGSALAVTSAHDCRRFGIYVVSASGGQPVRRSNQCRIDGTAGADMIRGTPYADVVDGHGGNDTIFTAAGNDVVYGGTGNDEIGAGPGNDIVYGGPGNDILSGGTGDDVIYAGPGRDKVGCGPGNDTAYIGPGDTVRDCEHVVRR